MGLTSCKFQLSINSKSQNALLNFSWFEQVQFFFETALPLPHITLSSLGSGETVHVSNTCRMKSLACNFVCVLWWWVTSTQIFWNQHCRNFSALHLKIVSESGIPWTHHDFSDQTRKITGLLLALSVWVNRAACLPLSPAVPQQPNSTGLWLKSEMQNQVLPSLCHLWWATMRKP